jgi:hypothetical protein
VPILRTQTHFRFVPPQAETRPRLTRQIPKLRRATSISGLKSASTNEDVVYPP